jgi:Putative beta-barrel porin-2, OmpL-like. bbp2
MHTTIAKIAAEEFSMKFSVALFTGIALALAFPAFADPMTTPAMSGPITANPAPLSVDAGPAGKIYITGALTGLALWQDHPMPGDRDTLADLSNGQVFIQKTDGWLQFYVQAGAYALPSLGTEYFKVDKITRDTFGYVPQAFVKIALPDNFSVQAGKLPTLIGAEYTFAFENMNIERGLLWNQEPAVSRGVQVNYSSGPLSISISWNDGYYSDRFNWISGLASYAIDGSNTIALAGGANIAKTDYSTFATPLYQNNSQILNLLYTYNAAPWVINPYIQFSRVSSSASLGIPHAASMWGVGLLATYAMSPHFSLSGRAEYEDSSGSLANGAPNLLYGPGSKAWSLTVTPTVQYGVFFARADASYVGASDITRGFALGRTFSNKSQTRLMFETGIVF